MSGYSSGHDQGDIIIYKFPMSRAHASIKGRVAAETKPLCVDLDGTLIHSDVLHESLILLAKQKPWLLFLVPFWVLGGKSHFKRKIAEKVVMNVATLPYRQDLLAWLQSEGEGGRDIYLVTASDEQFAKDIASHFPFFCGYWGSNGEINLSGRRKRELLVREFGERGFDYAGNAPIDLEIWRHVDKAVVAGANDQLIKEAREVAAIDQIFPGTHFRWGTIWKAIRVRQWVKNILVFVVLLTSHRLLDPAGWWRALAAFFAVSLCASAIYVVNDLLDLESDRQHATKCRRPFASGALPVAFGAVLVPVLLTLSCLTALLLPPNAWILLALYPAISLFYSFFLKRRLLVDVFTLALLYTLRILLGGAATGQECSSWLMGFSFFLFLSLALGKRASELHNLRAQQGEIVAGRAYYVWDLIEVHIFGVASGFAAALIMALYIHSDEVLKLYRQPHWLWIIVVTLVYWECRMWMFASRGHLDEDPIVFASRDKVTYFAGALIALSIFLATQTALPIPGLMH